MQKPPATLWAQGLAENHQTHGVLRPTENKHHFVWFHPWHIFLLKFLAFYFRISKACLYIYKYIYIYSEIMSGILSGIYSDIPSDIFSGILSGIFSGILSGIFSGILSGIFPGILSDIFFWHSIRHSIFFWHSLPIRFRIFWAQSYSTAVALRKKTNRSNQTWIASQTSPSGNLKLYVHVYDHICKN